MMSSGECVAKEVIYGSVSAVDGQPGSVNATDRDVEVVKPAGLVRVGDKVFDRMRVPHRFRRVDPSDYEGSFFSKKVEYCIGNVDIMAKEGVLLYLSGARGVGKTFFAVLLLKLARQLRYSGLFLTSQEYVSAFFGKRGFDAHQTIDSRARDVGFLVLDVVGGEAVVRGQGKEVIGKILEDLVRYRHEHLRPVILTSNLSLEELRVYYPGSFGSFMCANAVEFRVDRPMVSRDDSAGFASAFDGISDGADSD